jgi:hypothetical protein
VEGQVSRKCGKKTWFFEGSSWETKKAHGPASPWAGVSDFGGGAGHPLEPEDAVTAAQRQFQASMGFGGRSWAEAPELSDAAPGYFLIPYFPDGPRHSA